MTDLKAIRKQCILIREFIQGKSLAEFLEDELLQAGVERKLEIIGIAGADIRDADHDCFDQIEPLRHAIGLRNRLAHGYDELIDYERIWNVVEVSIPELLSQVDAVLDQIR